MFRKVKLVVITAAALLASSELVLSSQKPGEGTHCAWGRNKKIFQSEEVHYDISLSWRPPALGCGC